MNEADERALREYDAQMVFAAEAHYDDREEDDEQHSDD